MGWWGEKGKGDQGVGGFQAVWTQEGGRISSTGTGDLQNPFLNLILQCRYILVCVGYSIWEPPLLHQNIIFDSSQIYNGTILTYFYPSGVADTCYCKRVVKPIVTAHNLRGICTGLGCQRASTLKIPFFQSFSDIFFLHSFLGGVE